MVYGLFVKATDEEGVLDDGIVGTLTEGGGGGPASDNGEEFDAWIDDLRVKWEGGETPKRWSRNAVRRRYDEESPTY